MAYTPTDNRLGVQPIAVSSTTQNEALGTIVRAEDPTYGGGEFIYLLGVASTRIGSMVVYAPSTYQTALSPDTANQAQPVAIAMSANGAAGYGWYQISGQAVIVKTAVKVNPGVPLFQSATIGSVMPTAANGKEVLGARSANVATVVSATSTIQALINRPSMQGQTV